MKSNIKFIIGAVVIIVVIIALSFLGAKSDDYKENLLGIEYDSETPEVELNYDTENPLVALYIEKYGSIVIELYPEVAPNTVDNFIYLAMTGFYDDNTMHRLVKNFVLQGGDPDGEGTGGPDYRIKGEFESNGFKNDLSHKKGIVSMARSSDSYDSAGSQFFICLDDATSLDGDYAAFGKVIDGWKNIEAIVKNEVVANPETGKLKENLVIKKAVVDLKGKEFVEPEKVSD